MTRPEHGNHDQRVTCVHCKRSRPQRVMDQCDDESWECKDIIGCSEATQWA